MTIGSQLRSARKKRKRTITDVSQETKIQPWILEALEADRLQDGMSPIYVKGFLGTYARVLHLEPGPLLAQLSWPTEEVEEEAPPPPAPSLPFTLPSVRFTLPSVRMPWEKLKSLRTPALIVLGVAFMIVVNPGRWLPTIQLPHQQASVSGVRDQGSAVPLEGLKTIPTEPLELSVKVLRPTWIRVRADGKLLTQQRLRRGAHETWKASKELELIIAKPSQVDITLNGQSINPLAVAHQGRLLITHRGVSRLPDPEF